MNGLVIERVGGSQFYYTHTILHEWVGYIVKVRGFSFSVFTHHFAGVGYSKSSGVLIFTIHTPFCRNELRERRAFIIPTLFCMNELVIVKVGRFSFLLLPHHFA